MTAPMLMAVDAAVPARAQPSKLTSPFSVGEGRPRSAVPPGACDSHIHIFDPQFPPASDRPEAEIDNATVEAYQQFQARIGTQRVVVVTPSTYGVDNRATMLGVAGFGKAARGVIMVDSDAPPSDLAAMSEAGVCGIRVNFVTQQGWGPTTIQRLRDTARIAADLGWHIQIYASGSQIAEMKVAIAALPTPVVIDHLASVTPVEGVNSPGHKAALELLETDRVWLKLSGAYIVSYSGPQYLDVDPVAQSYVKTAPERLVWGSDWPHRGRRNPFPDDAILFDALSRWAPTELTRRHILVDNPSKLYGFK